MVFSTLVFTLLIYKIVKRSEAARSDAYDTVLIGNKEKKLQNYRRYEKKARRKDNTYNRQYIIQKDTMHGCQQQDEPKM